MKRLLGVVVVLSTFLLPGAARGAITASFSGGVLTVSSDNAGNVNETFALRDEGTQLGVRISPGTTNDPDGGGTACSLLSSTEVRCVRADVDSVRIVAGNGTDTIIDALTVIPALLEGGPGNDAITTVAGTDADLRGQAGQDTLVSGGAADALDGGDDADTLTAVADHAFDSSDTGGPGDDTFVGNPDLADRLAAEAGADTYTLGTHGAGAFDTGDPARLQLDAAADVVDYGGVTGPITVRVNGVADDGRAGERDDVGADVEAVYGTAAADVLQASANAMVLNGGDGADQLLGGAGPDELDGGAGSDVLRGGDGDDDLLDGDFTPSITSAPLPAAGDDVLDGGPGADTLRSDRGADDLSGGPGLDRATFGRPVPQAPSVTTPVAQAGFTISLDDVANDGQTGTGEGDDVRSDVERIATGDGDDVVTGSAGADDIATAGGNDVVDPGGGPDVVDLGRGDDRVSAVDQTTDVLRCGSGADTATADLPGGQAVRADALFDCETVTGTPFPAPPAAGGPAPGPAPDTTRPVVTLSSKAIAAKAFLADGRLALTVACSEACSARGEAYTTLARIARAGDFSVGTGSLKAGTGKRTLRIVVAKKLRDRFKAKLRTRAQRKRGVRFSVVVTARDAAGNATTATRAVTVKG